MNANDKVSHHPWKALNQFVDEKNEQGRYRKFTLILGAGIHNLHDVSNWQENEARKLLSSWSTMLEKVGGDNDLMLSPTLGWEFLSIDKCTKSEEQANKREKQLLKSLQSEISNAEDALLKFCEERLNPLAQVMRSPAVSDVINLNVDLLVERLYMNDESIPGLVDPSKANNAEVQSVKSGSLHRRRELTCNNSGSKLRVWHPHGDRCDYESMAFGIWRYERLLNPLVAARRNIKMREKKAGYAKFQSMVAKQPENWLELMMFRPLIFIGTSLDYAEWDIWYGLMARWRNFAKASNNSHLPPVWYLDVEGRSGSNISKVPNGRVQRLAAPDWETAWHWLADSLNPGGGCRL